MNWPNVSEVCVDCSGLRGCPEHRTWVPFTSDVILEWLEELVLHDHHVEACLLPPPAPSGGGSIWSKQRKFAPSSPPVIGAWCFVWMRFFLFPLPLWQKKEVAMRLQNCNDWLSFSQCGHRFFSRLNVVISRSISHQSVEEHWTTVAVLFLKEKVIRF